MKKQIKWPLVLVLIAGLVIALDQYTKALVRQNLAVGQGFAPIAWLGNFFQILHWKNTGAAFGFFQNANLLLMILTAMITVVLSAYFFSLKEGHAVVKTGLALAIGGALGNLIDRIMQGHVTDFLSFGRFPVFNVADSAVTLGVALMILGMMLEAKHEYKKEAPETHE
ncbi:MAG: signal peptidase II [Anaerolineaceae bacterium]|nr:signal peptidase II [Anaerolineaceae bacterium]